MNRLPDAKRAAILRCLVEGSSVRSTARITDTAKATVLKLLVEVGEFCSIYQDHLLRNLPCERIEADEIWAYVGAKRKNATKPGDGDLWTFTAIDPDSKLMVSWLVGDRSEESATAFMLDLASRVSGKIQLTTDGHGMYLPAIRKAFSWKDVDYAMLVKTFGQPGSLEEQRRYSPPVCTGAKKVRMIGNPDPDLVSTSYVERANLTMRMSMRRFTRLTNAFSRKVENHAHAVSLMFMYYNFCQPHGTLTKARGGLKTTPAMAAGLADRPWRVEDILAKMDLDRSLIGA
jgi:IS1 family transposase